MAHEMREPVGTVIGSYQELAIGSLHRGMHCGIDGKVYANQPYVILRPATLEEFQEQRGAGNWDPAVLAGVKAFYLVSTD